MSLASIGGQGGDLSRGDVRMLGRAIRQRWGMSDDLRALVVSRLADVVKAAEEPRCTVAAAKALIDADRLNMEQEKRDAEAENDRGAPLKVIVEYAHKGLPAPAPPEPAEDSG